ncbi:ferritin [Candidatus Sumerlaeota bacterium]|nr:ferritin [Candidatus Sumerlaeota bacterium]
MISDKMQEAINQQINAEMFSAYLYLSMSAWCSDKRYDGFAQWFKVQAQEEMAHAMKFYDYIFEQGGQVKLLAIDAPKAKYASLMDCAKKQLEHEKKVTALINGLMDIAKKEKDYATDITLQWFISEQVEEEKNAEEIIGKLEMIGDTGRAIYMLDKEMGKRKFEED